MLLLLFFLLYNQPLRYVCINSFGIKYSNKCSKTKVYIFFSIQLNYKNTWALLQMNNWQFFLFTAIEITEPTFYPQAFVLSDVLNNVKLVASRTLCQLCKYKTCTILKICPSVHYTNHHICINVFVIIFTLILCYIVWVMWYTCSHFFTFS